MIFKSETIFVRLGPRLNQSASNFWTCFQNMDVLAESKIFGATRHLLYLLVWHDFQDWNDFRAAGAKSESVCLELLDMFPIHGCTSTIQNFWRYALLVVFARLKWLSQLSRPGMESSLFRTFGHVSNTWMHVENPENLALRTDSSLYSIYWIDQIFRRLGPVVNQSA